MERKFTGTLSAQLAFQEHIFQCLQEGVPFVCTTEYMFCNIENPDMYMEYIDKVTSMCRFKGVAGDMYVVYPKSYRHTSMADMPIPQ